MEIKNLKFFTHYFYHDIRHFDDKRSVSYCGARKLFLISKLLLSLANSMIEFDYFHLHNLLSFLCSFSPGAYSESVQPIVLFLSLYQPFIIVISKMSLKRSFPFVLRRSVRLAKKPRFDYATMNSAKVSASALHPGNQEQNSGDEIYINQTEPSYDHLPHLPLITLLEKLPLVDLLPLRAVCQRWDDFATNIVAKKRKHLYLSSYYRTEYEKATFKDNVRVRIDLSRFLEIDLVSFDFIIGIDETLFIEWQQGKGTKLPKPWVRFLSLKRNKAVEKLTTTFPDIQTLVLFDCLFNEKEIVMLLTSWCDTLVSLKLVVVQHKFDWSMIFDVFKRMPRLQHLSLFSTTGFIDRPKLPLLSQLKSFQITFYDHRGGKRQCWLSHLLAQLNHTVLQHVDVGVFTSQDLSYFFRYNLKKLFLCHPTIAAKLRRLQFPSISPRFFHFLATRFILVSWLNVELTSINDLKQISRLSRLNFLALRSNRRPYSDCPLNQTLNKWDRRTMAAIKPMVSVTNLFLLDFEIDKELLKKLFPNVIKVERQRRGDDNDVDYKY